MSAQPAHSDAEIVAAHRSVRALFRDVLSAVPADGWDGPTACPDWTVRDVVAHVVWGLDVAVLCAEGREIEDRSAGPGRPEPAVDLGGADPLEAFDAARSRADEAITPGTAALPAPAFQRKALPDSTLAFFLRTMVGDTLCHAWDVASRLGATVEPDEATLAVAWDAVRDGVPRREPYFAGEITVPDDAPGFDRYLAWLGRDPRPTE